MKKITHDLNHDLIYILLHTQSIVCATVDSQCLEYWAYITLQKGFTLAGMKMTLASEDQIKQHYNDIIDKPFFPRFLKYVTSSPVIVMVSLF